MPPMRSATPIRQAGERGSAGSTSQEVAGCYGSNAQIEDFRGKRGERVNCDRERAFLLRSSVLVREALEERLKRRSPNSRVRDCHVTVAVSAGWNHPLGGVRRRW